MTHDEVRDLLKYRWTLTHQAHDTGTVDAWHEALPDHIDYATAREAMTTAALTGRFVQLSDLYANLPHQRPYDQEGDWWERHPHLENHRDHDPNAHEDQPSSYTERVRAEMAAHHKTHGTTPTTRAERWALYHRPEDAPPAH